ncbi:MAG: histidine kinase [Zetaproteobacteria bacterium CG_4_9_14_3_um_filter_49_83]|nr:MAG: histidine kinase [Zetaproteobacteria bacterium CG1_02_49_23]PIQ31667.1 MAG: histidine kinase [Zetaproteobacteria bacterium CG17_big_fil_post_rev_8_21_14_2_50_50_13]PIV31168.1 MAG: histidine kinase [Zetaproteobacteria bacterium CG02_land_8_20_14_3_00_50_9]PIY55533.1 MAG: histidine kinase [Zetaproteobacteria bacterium CG_4_10_14_0_8_um_filter_49_80]PJA34889.1 MAG: histidine kinase [Zetaproteobacteria bacterium CG_4_9_14_3_um_filter_49_83]
MLPGYKVRFETYTFGGTDYRIRSLQDVLQFSDRAGIAEQAGISSAQWSLFGVVWPSSQVLAQLMSVRPAIDGIRILEVGCGLGLASLVLKHRGADITSSDYHPLASPFLAVNAMLNHLDDIDTITCDWTSIANSPQLFDLIIGSDLLYEQDHFTQLSAFILRHAQPRVEIIIIDPNRGNAGKFNTRMKKLGFSCYEERTQITLHNDEPYRGRIMTYKRAAL